MNIRTLCTILEDAGRHEMNGFEILIRVSDTEFYELEKIEFKNDCVEFLVKDIEPTDFDLTHDPSLIEEMDIEELAQQVEDENVEAYLEDKALETDLEDSSGFGDNGSNLVEE